jgi:hypothetical protein
LATLKQLTNTISWVLSLQEVNGSLGAPMTPGGERATRIASLLQWAALRLEPHPIAARAQQGLDKWVDYILTEQGAWETGLNVYGLPTGFVGLAVADLIQPWLTWSPQKPTAPVAPVAAVGLQHKSDDDDAVAVSSADGSLRLSFDGARIASTVLGGKPVGRGQAAFAVEEFGGGAASGPPANSSANLAGSNGDFAQADPSDANLAQGWSFALDSTIGCARRTTPGPVTPPRLR